MTGSLKDFLLDHISRSGPMDITTFMAYALGHPKHGYYMTQQPFGADGDFTTAPEVSQMFGELIGAWVVDLWMKMGSPEFILAEGGPGRGTLMADMLRATKKMKGFHDAMEVHLVETSPLLQKIQQEALADYKAVWHPAIDRLPKDRPVIFVANELIDALPIRQLQKTADGWKEVAVYNKGGALVLGLRDFATPVHFDAPEGAVFEFSPARDAFVRQLCKILKAQRGAALLIDYGSEHPEFGSSLHAIHKHSRVDFLEQVDGADLSANVNFSDIKAIAQEEKIAAHGSIAQGTFLQNLGIEARAAMLSRANPDKAEEVEKALRRLTSSDEMGQLFKVMGLMHDASLTPAGF